MSAKQNLSVIRNDRINVVDLTVMPDVSFAEYKKNGGVYPSRLPVATFTEETFDLRFAAVVSWRWDIDMADQPSLNIAAAICAAKQCGFEYLVIDVVSIPLQRMNLDVANEVAALSRFFSLLPIIAVYDQVVDEGKHTWSPQMNRPWIFFEIRRHFKNGKKVIMVTRFGEYANMTTRLGRKISNPKEFFGILLEGVMQTGYSYNPLKILCGHSTMKMLSDFSYILPGHYEILNHCHTSLSKNDYLLACAIFCAAFEQHTGLNFSAASRVDITRYKYERFSLEEIQGGPIGKKIYYDGSFDIRLDGVSVAKFQLNLKADYYDSLMYDPDYSASLMAEPDAGTRLHKILYPQSLSEYESRLPELIQEFSPSAKVNDINLEVICFSPDEDKMTAGTSLPNWE